MSSQRKSGVLLTYLGLFVNLLSGFVLVPLMLKLLGQDEFGLYNIVGSFLAYLIVLDMGLANAVIYFVSKYKANNERKGEENFLATIQIFYLLLTAVLIVASAVIYRYLPVMFGKSLSADDIEKLKIMFVILVINASVTLLSNVFQSVITAYEKFFFISITNVLRQLFRIMFIVIVMFAGYKIIAVVMVDTIIAVAFCIWKVYYAVVHLRIRMKLHSFKKAYISEVFRYAFFIFLIMLVSRITWEADSVILGVMTSASTVALYAVSVQFSQTYMNFSTAISNVLMPKTVASIEQGATNEELTAEMIRVGRLQLIVCGLVLSGFILFGRKFIVMWAGSEFTFAYYLALIVMVPMTISLCQSLGINILQAQNKHHFRAILYSIMAIVNIVVSVVLVRWIGVTGAAVGTAVSIIFGNIIGINVYYHKVIGLNMFRFFREVSKGLLPAVLFSLILGSGTALIRDASWILLGLQMMLYVLVYSVIMWAYAFNSFEKRLFFGMTKGIVSKYKKRMSH